MKNNNLKNKVCVVVGGTRGIGYSIASRMARLGMNVAVVARSAEELKKTKENLETYNIKCLGLQCDVTDYNAIGEVFKTIYASFKRIDLLVNSAGTGVMTPFEDITAEDIDRTIDVNLKGTIYSVKQVVQFMKDTGGNILNISSMSAIRGIPDPVNNNGIYTATKFAVNGFSECMQKYLLRYGIRVTTLCPGSTDTSWWERWTHSFSTDKMLPSDTLADMAEMIVTAPDSVLFKQMQVLPTVEVDNF